MIKVTRFYIHVEESRLKIFAEIHPGLNHIHVRANDQLLGTHCVVNGIEHTLGGSLVRAENDGAWFLSWGSCHLRRVEPKPNSVFDRDPTANAMAAVRAALNAAVNEWASKYPEVLAEGVERARQEFQEQCDGTAKELHDEINRVMGIAIESKNWDQARLIEAVEKREAYANNNFRR